MFFSIKETSPWKIKKRKTVKNSKPGNFVILLLLMIMLMLVDEEPIFSFLLGLTFKCIY